MNEEEEEEEDGDKRINEEEGLDESTLELAKLITGEMGVDVVDRNCPPLSIVCEDCCGCNCKGEGTGCRGGCMVADMTVEIGVGVEVLIPRASELG